MALSAGEPKHTINNEPKSTFNKARYDYAAKQYDNQEARQRFLETKAQLYLTFVTAYLAAIFLSLPFIQMIGSLLTQNIDNVWKWIIPASIVILAIALFCALWSVLMAIRVQNYRRPYPEQLVLSLFDLTNGYFLAQTEAALADATALTYAESTEHNASVNARKAKWVDWAGISIAVSMVALMVLLGTTVYLQLYITKPTSTPPTQIILLTPSPITPTPIR